MRDTLDLADTYDSSYDPDKLPNIAALYGSEFDDEPTLKMESPFKKERSTHLLMTLGFGLIACSTLAYILFR